MKFTARCTSEGAIHGFGRASASDHRELLEQAYRDRIAFPLSRSPTALSTDLRAAAAMVGGRPKPLVANIFHWPRLAKR
jgi:hypothetical protein